MHVLIDPYILATPSSLSSCTARKYLSQVTDWLAQLIQFRDLCSISEATVYQLLNEGKMPTAPFFKRLLAIGEIVEHNDIDLMQQVRRVTEVRPYLEDRCGIRELVSSDAHATPEALFERLGVTLGSVFRDACLMSIFAMESDTKQGELYVASCDCEHLEESEVVAGGKVELIEKTDGSLHTPLVTVKGSLDLLADLENVREPACLADVYNDPARAAELAGRMLLGGRYQATRVVLAGNEFVESIEHHNIQRNGVVLRALYTRVALAAADLLESVKGAKLHDVRTSEASDAKQVKRDDGAKLWRCMVTKKGAGYRLQYWSLPNGTIELQKVGLECEV